MSPKTETRLSQEKCVACQSGAEAASPEEQAEWLKETPGWRIEPSDGVPELVRIFQFEDFRQALDFTIKVGEAAEAQDHHPAILLEWGRATVRWSTHKISNLHRNDFVMAARTSALFDAMPAQGRR